MNAWSEDLEIEREICSRKLERDWLCRQELPRLVKRLLSHLDQCLSIINTVTVASGSFNGAKANSQGITKLAVAVPALPSDHPQQERQVGVYVPADASSTGNFATANSGPETAVTTLAVTVAGNDSLKGFLTLNGTAVVKGELSVKSPSFNRGQLCKFHLNGENAINLPQLVLVRRRLTSLRKQLLQVCNFGSARLSNVPSIYRLFSDFLLQLSNAKRDIISPQAGYQFPLTVANKDSWTPSLPDELTIHIHVTKTSLVTTLTVLNPCASAQQETTPSSLAKVTFASVLAPGVPTPLTAVNTAVSGHALVSPISSAHGSSTNLTSEDSSTPSSSFLSLQHGRNASQPASGSASAAVTNKLTLANTLSLQHSRSVSNSGLSSIKEASMPIIGAKFTASQKPKPATQVVLYNGRTYHICEQIVVESNTTKFGILLTALRNLESTVREMQIKVEPFLDLC